MTSRAKAGEGILFGDYIKDYEQPEPLVRAQLDRGELRYTWKDINGNARASDDGDPLPPKGWWLSNLMIDYERHSVRGNAMFGPVFPMFFVRVFPAITAAKPANPKGGRVSRKVQGAVRELYPDGVPDHVSTETVLQAVIAKLGRDVGWHTVNRALGRE